MMITILSKKIKYENCLYILLCLIGISYGIYTINNNLTGMRIFASNITGYCLLSIMSFLLISEIILLFIKKFYMIKRIFYLIVIIITIFLFIDIFILGIIRSYITVINMGKKPTVLDPLNIRLVYICIKNGKAILLGVWTTIWLSMCGTIIGLCLGLLFITLRSLEVSPRDNEFVAFMKKIACGFVKTYVTVFRGTPMMVQAIIIYYFLPGILDDIFHIDQEILNNIFTVSISGLITVSLNTTAYLTEVLRGGIDALHSGQMEAARSLGMTKTKAMIHIILPQGIKNALPSICNEFIINIKDTSVLSVISVMDLFFVIDSINGKNASQDGIFIAGIIYLCLTYGISKLLILFEKKMNLVSKPLPSSN